MSRPTPDVDVDVPPLIVSSTNAIELLDMWINDLPLSQREIASYLPIDNESYKVPAYFFRHGTNAIKIRYKANTSSGQPLALDVRIGGADLVGTFDACTDSEATCEDTATFDIAGPVPAWGWLDGEDIAATGETRDSLYKAYDQLLARVRAAVPRDEDGAPIAGANNTAGARRLRDELAKYMLDRPAPADLDDLVKLASHPLSGVNDLAPDMPELDMGVDLEVIAGGKLARLWRGTMPILGFAGGAHDAPDGEMGPFDVWFDVWWRREGGTWKVSAIWRTGVMPELPAMAAM